MFRRSCTRAFFGKGWDNAALDVVYRGILRKPEVNHHLRNLYIPTLDQHTMNHFTTLALHGNVPRVFLTPDLGDPHRLLKAYSLTAYPILNERGDVLTCDVNGTPMEAFADPDDDYAKVVIPHVETVVFLSQQLLTTMEWEASPRGAASMLESLYRGAEVPDHVFATPAVVERQW